MGSTAPGRYGADPPRLALAEISLASAWNVQGDAARVALADGVQRSFGIVLPATAGGTAKADALTALWLGPTSWLLIGHDSEALGSFVGKRDALNIVGGALFDVSASRVAYRIAGPNATSVLAAGCPLDLHPRAFSPGTSAQSLYGHVNALYYKPDDSEAFIVMVARSFARDVWHALCSSSAQYGYEVTEPVSFGRALLR